jgi:DNA-binding IclR family transcriptional regulator
MDGREPDRFDDAARPRRRGIQSIVTGFRVLDFLVKAGQPVPLREIATGTGLSASKLQFYLISLAEVGVVAQDPNSGFYGLGPYTLQLGISGLQQFDIYKSAFARMERLAQETGHSVFLGVWGNEGPTIVHRSEGSYNRSIFELRLGSVLPVLRSALGRLFVAHLPASLTAGLVDQELSEFTRNNLATSGIDVPRTRLEVQALSEAIRAQGFSTARSGLLSDHTAISAPVFDHAGKIISGLTIMGHVNSLNDADDSPIVAEMIGLAAEISAEAGATVRHYLPV